LTQNKFVNGAENLVKTLIHNEVTVCFANPGTSEMHFVAALDKASGMRSVLGLFEGVVTGAADGYYRISGKPAATLLHLGPGLGNGLANLHNAKKAGSGVVNIVGEHATYHIECNAPLTSNIQMLATPMSDWVKTSLHPSEVAKDGAEAISVARTAPGKVATLILPADTAWGDSGGFIHQSTFSSRTHVQSSLISKAAEILKRHKVAILLGGVGVRGHCLELAGQIASKSGCTLLSEYNNALMNRGAGVVRTQRIPYAVNDAVEFLRPYDFIILVGSKIPVAFFAYPEKPSYLASERTEIFQLASTEEDIEASLNDLAETIGAGSINQQLIPIYKKEVDPTGAITNLGIAQIISNNMPEGAIVVDESISTGRAFELPTSTALRHDWLNIMGGSIGFGLPTAIGASIAAPNRVVLALEGDGSAMYTFQSLWTMARENLNIKVLIFANQSYKILKGELKGIEASSIGVQAEKMLSLNQPSIDWVSLSKGLGVDSVKVNDLSEFSKIFQFAVSSRGPFLIQIDCS